MSAKHTPENWRYEAETRTIRSVPANYWLATMDSWDGAINNAANAARIVACVNACERIEHPENLRENLDELGRRFNAAKAEVERLREALAGCVKQCADYENMTDDCAAAFRKARAALKGAA